MSGLYLNYCFCSLSDSDTDVYSVNYIDQEQLWIILKKEDRKSKRSVGQIGRQAIIMRMRAERVIKAVDILKNGKF